MDVDTITHVSYVGLVVGAVMVESMKDKVPILIVDLVVDLPEQVIVNHDFKVAVHVLLNFDSGKSEKEVSDWFVMHYHQELYFKKEVDLVR